MLLAARTALFAVAPQPATPLCFGRRNALYRAAPTPAGRASGARPSTESRRPGTRRPWSRASPGPPH
eukprot:8005000-Alexandrium_andersonii.AAC.1